MADTYIDEKEEYSDHVRMVMNGEPINGGPTGPVNIALQQLANRTAFLQKKTNNLQEENISDSAVTSSKIAAGAVTAEKIEKKTLETAIVSSASSGTASAPGYYKRSEEFTSTSSARTTVTTPTRLWVNIGTKGYVKEGAESLDLSKDATWSANAKLWEAKTAYKVNDVIYSSDTKNGYYYRCVTAGTSSALTPTLPTTIGATYNDGDVQWLCEYDYTVSSNRAGKDFYIYACQPTGETETTPKIVLSANSTVPVGYNADNSRKIGGFHCECADIGDTGDTNHPLNNYKAGDVLPHSIWDISHRPKSEPEGMAYVPGLDKWFDIYISSWNGSKLVSVFGGVIADGGSSPAWHGEKFIEQFGLQKKMLMWRDEFMVMAKGSNEETSIKGSADPGTTGGHVDTAGRRMVSYYGHEDCCGTIWQWARDTFENYPGAVWNNNSGNTTYTDGAMRHYLDGYQWRKEPVYDSAVDSRSYGAAIGLLRRAIVGASWSGGADCGSRAVHCNDFSSSVDAAIAARGASEPLHEAA